MRNSPYLIHNQMNPNHWNPETDGPLEMAVKPTLSLASYEDYLKTPTLCVRQVKYWEQSAITHTMRVSDRKGDIAAANRTNNKFLKSAAFKALNNLKKIGG